MSNVTIEQQEKLGIVRRQNYVAAQPETTALARRTEATMQPMPHATIELAVTPTATTHVDMRTSAQDRAVGFIIASMPRTFAFSLAVTLAAITLAGASLLMAFVILFATFSIIELGSYIFTLGISAEGTAHYEARQKWQVIKNEQRERWNHYNKNNGGDNG